MLLCLQPTLEVCRPILGVNFLNMILEHLQEVRIVSQTVCIICLTDTKLNSIVSKICTLWRQQKAASKVGLLIRF